MAPPAVRPCSGRPAFYPLALWAVLTQACLCWPLEPIGGATPSVATVPPRGQAALICARPVPGAHTAPSRPLQPTHGPLHRQGSRRGLVAPLPRAGGLLSQALPRHGAQRSARTRSPATRGLRCRWLALGRITAPACPLQRLRRNSHAKAEVIFKNAPRNSAATAAAIPPAVGRRSGTRSPSRPPVPGC